MNLSATLKKHFGFDTFKGHQEEIIQALMQKHNVFVLMPTGGGKSLCYQLPALLLEGTAIIISPLIALMKNQVDAIRHICEEDSIAHYLNSSLTKVAINQVKEDVLSSKTKLLYVAPETLTKEENIPFFRSFPISFFAVDEAHCISEWGHDFRPEYRKIRSSINNITQAPIIALTATATDKVKTDIIKILDINDVKEFKSSFNRSNLYYEVRNKNEQTEIEIIKFIKQNAGKSGIIYCLNRKKVEELAELLKLNNIKAAAYHAGLIPLQRSLIQDQFINEEIDIIVATIAFGMGIDKPDVRFVIHYDTPKSLENYYQETGRAGRDGGEGKCITYYSSKDIRKYEKFLEGKTNLEQEINRFLLKEITNYIESSICRRITLLNYFGETYPHKVCGNCDNCLNPHKQVEAQKELQNLLSLIVTLKKTYKENYLLDLLIGKETKENIANKHHELELFACGDELEEAFWSQLIQQALLSGYIKKETENYGAISITPQGKKFIKNPTSFVVSTQEEQENDIKPGEGTTCSDPQLFQMLKDLRKTMSKELDVPPYVIFQDPSLEVMATLYPITEEELQGIPGVGAGKAKRYGQKFCDLIKLYCKENQIDRPEDLRIKTIANKSKIKVNIIQSIDRKIPLDDIATALCIEFDELLKEIESIVFSGTRLNIDYFIYDILDEEHVDELYQYFQETETDDLSLAFEELGAYYSEEEIRLVRVKFISEMAN